MFETFSGKITNLGMSLPVIKGVTVLGYLFWTISDNWEWADGYGPKFGLAAVDRSNNLARIPRPSYHLFTKVTTPTLLLP